MDPDPAVALDPVIYQQLHDVLDAQRAPSLSLHGAQPAPSRSSSSSPSPSSSLSARAAAFDHQASDGDRSGCAFEGNRKGGRKGQSNTAHGDGALHHHHRRHRRHRHQLHDQRQRTLHRPQLDTCHNRPHPRIAALGLESDQAPTLDSTCKEDHHHLPHHHQQYHTELAVLDNNNVHNNKNNNPSSSNNNVIGRSNDHWNCANPISNAYAHNTATTSGGGGAGACSSGSSSAAGALVDDDDQGGSPLANPTFGDRDNNKNVHAQAQGGSSYPQNMCPPGQAPAFAATDLPFEKLVSDVECGVCGFAGSEAEVSAHSDREHARMPVFECGQCGFLFWNGAALEAHVASSHRAAAALPASVCLLCTAQLPTPADLDAHIREKHTPVQPLFCRFCGVLCVGLRALAHHSEDHHAAEFIPCLEEHCNAFFRTRAALKAHMETLHAYSTAPRRPPHQPSPPPNTTPNYSGSTVTPSGHGPLRNPDDDSIGLAAIADSPDRGLQAHPTNGNTKNTTATTINSSSMHFEPLPNHDNMHPHLTQSSPHGHTAAQDDQSLQIQQMHHFPEQDHQCYRNEQRNQIQGDERPDEREYESDDEVDRQRQRNRQHQILQDALSLTTPSKPDGMSMQTHADSSDMPISDSPCPTWVGPLPDCHLEPIDGFFSRKQCRIDDGVNGHNSDGGIFVSSNDIANGGSGGSGANGGCSVSNRNESFSNMNSNDSRDYDSLVQALSTHEDAESTCACVMCGLQHDSMELLEQHINFVHRSTSAPKVKLEFMANLPHRPTLRRTQTWIDDRISLSVVKGLVKRGSESELTLPCKINTKSRRKLAWKADEERALRSTVATLGFGDKAFGIFQEAHCPERSIAAIRFRAYSLRLHK